MGFSFINMQKVIMKKLIILLLVAGVALGSENFVHVGQTKLFAFDHDAGAVTAAMRAQTASAAIEKVMEDPEAETDSIQIRRTNGNLVLSFKHTKLLTVYPIDTTGTGLSQAEIAERWRRIVIDGIESERKRSISAGNLAKLALGVLFPFLVIVAYILIHRLYLWLSKAAVNQEGKLFRGLSVRGTEIMPIKLQIGIALKFLVFLKWALLVVIFYAMILIFFNLFPATKGYTEAILETSINWLRSVGGVLVDVIKFAIFGAVFYIVARLIWGLTDLFFRHYKASPDSARIPPAAVEPLRRIVKGVIVFLYLVVLVAAIPGAGEYYALAILTAVIIITAVAGLPFLRSGITGFSMLFLQKLKVGDEIVYRGGHGVIESVGIVWTTIMFAEGHEMTVLNSELASGGLVRRNKVGEEENCRNEQM